MNARIKVLIVDDSKVCSTAIAAILNETPDIEVVGIAKDGEMGVELTKSLKPDLVIMDIFMPQMDGVEATKVIMQQCPTPIIVVSSPSNAKESNYVFEALEAGALTLIKKPIGFLEDGFGEVQRLLVQSVRALSSVHVVKRKAATIPSSITELTVDKSMLKAKIVALGCSTGGPEALHNILSQLPGHFPIPIVITQHITKGFLPGLVKWLQSSSALSIHIAEDQQDLLPGSVYFAADEAHLLIQKNNFPKAVLDMSDPLDHFKPSINKMFNSIATSYPGKAIGGILTGMGKDGVQGLLKMRQTGCVTFAQSEATSVIYGMPAAAIDLQATDCSIDLNKISKFLTTLLEGQEKK